VIHRILYNESKEKDNPNEESLDINHSFYAPYHPRAEKLFKLLEDRFNFKTIYKKTPTLEHLICKHREPPDKLIRKNTVYKVPCTKPCPVSYIGQSKHTVVHRMEQHINMCKEKNKKRILKSSKKRQWPCIPPSQNRT
jgi:hypothetical protein